MKARGWALGGTAGATGMSHGQGLVQPEGVL